MNCTIYVHLPANTYTVIVTTKTSANTIIDGPTSTPDLLLSDNLTFSKNSSYIIFSPYQINANGTSTGTAVVCVNDLSGYPISGKIVTLYTRGNSDTIYDSRGAPNTGSTQTTDANGKCTFTIVSNYTGQDTIVAVVSAAADDTITRGVNKQGAVGIWNFDDGNSITLDASGYNNTGTLKNGPVYVSGKYGSALQFNGTNNYVEVLHSDSLNLTEEITIMAWVNSPDYSRTAGQHIVSKRNGNLGWMLQTTLGNKGYGYVSINDNLVTAPGIVTLTNNQWYHLTVTYNGERVKLYVNGNFDNQSDIVKGSITSGNNPLYIGCQPGPTYYFLGIIDEVQIYNRALSADEIYASYKEKANIYFTKLKISSPSFKIKVGISSPKITVISGDIGNTNTSFSGTVSLTSSSESRVFSPDGISWTSGDTIINLNNGVGYFYYKDNKVGCPVITIFREGFGIDTQKETIMPVLEIISDSFIITSIQISDTIIILAKDGFSNTATNFSESASLSSSSPKGKFSVTSTPWNETTTISFSEGLASFNYKDVRGGYPIITVSYLDISCTQQNMVTQPIIIFTKIHTNLRTNASGTMAMLISSGDTIEYTLLIENIGTETATNIIIVDTYVFDTNVHNPVYFLEMTTSSDTVDTYAYTIDGTTWVFGSPPLLSENVKGLRWKINFLGIYENNKIRNIYFKVKVK